MKRRKYVAPALLIFIVSTGCASSFRETAWEGHALLGKDYKTFNPPHKPPALEAVPPKAENPTGEITLEQALALGLLQNPELIAFSWEIRAAEARVLQASLLPNPELSTEVENFGGHDELDGFTGAETTVQISQLIETGGKRSKRKHVAQIEKDLACWDYESKRLDVLADITGLFWETYAAQERNAIAQELATLAAQAYDAVVERVTAGKVAPLEEIQARVSVTTATIDLEQTKHELAAARKKLAASWGSAEPLFSKIAPKTDGLMPVPDQQLLANLISQNPDIARWTAEVERQRAAVAVSDAGAIPDVTISAGPRYYNDTDTTAFIMGITVPLPVFNRNQGERKEARFKYASAEDNRRAAFLKAAARFGQAYQEMSSAYLTAVSLRDTALPAADSAFGAALEGYREGKFGYLQVLDAQRTLFEVKKQYMIALADYHAAKTVLERLIGQNIPVQQ